MNIIQNNINGANLINVLPPKPIKMNKRIFAHIPDEFASGYYRVKLPFQQCYKDMADDGVELYADTQVKAGDLNYDAYIFSRIPPPPLLAFIRELLGRNKTIVWSLDDDIKNFPTYQPNANLFNNSQDAYEFMKFVSNYIMVSTPFLAKQINEPEKTIILPNLLDLNTFPVNNSPKDDKIKILWQGSNFHELDIAQLTFVIPDIIKDFPQVQFIFYGDAPDQFTTFKRLPDRSEVGVVDILPQYSQNIKYIQRQEFRYFKDTMSYIQPDIGLCPLVKDIYNKSKSDLKIKEYTKIGATVIASNIEPYQGWKDECLLVNTIEDWKDGIKRLIEQPEYRLNLYNKANEKLVQESWNLATRKIWLDGFKRIVKGGVVIY